MGGGTDTTSRQASDWRQDHSPPGRPGHLGEGSRRAHPRVWVLTTSRAGDNAQLRVLAEALGWPCRVVRLEDTLPEVVADRIADALRGPKGSPRRLGPSQDWPDLVLAAGGRPVSAARRIRALSGGRTRVVHVGRPWARLDTFDLVITTPQYRLPEEANILCNALPLNRSDPDAARAAARRWSERLGALPRPWIGVLVGGPSGSCAFGERSADRLAARANYLASSSGGTLLVTTSPRTPPAVCALLESRLAQSAGLFHRWRPDADENPHPAVLALADRFLVTGDSASMLAEACSTGKPVELVELPPRRLSRLATTLFSALGANRLGRRLVGRGLLVPPRDMPHLHRILRERGLVASAAGPADAGAALARELADAVARIHDLMGMPRPEETTADALALAGG